MAEKDDDIIDRVTDAVRGAEVFLGDFNTDLAMGHIDLIHSVFEDLCSRFPKKNKVKLMKQAEKEVQKTDPVGYEEQLRLIDLTRSILADKS